MCSLFFPFVQNIQVLFIFVQPVKYNHVAFLILFFIEITEGSRIYRVFIYSVIYIYGPRFMNKASH